MWGTESEKMLELLSHPNTREHMDQDDKEMFNKIVAEYMADDMLRIDSLDQNIQSVMHELTRMERHALMLGQVLGDKVVALERM
jgi:predicted transcriptional regulator